MHSKRHRCNTPKLSKDNYRTLLDYHWPGNVRELSNRIERFVLLDDWQELVSGLQTSIQQVRGLHALPDFTLPNNGINWETFECQCLSDALKQKHGNKTKAAAFLQMSYKAFLYRLEKYQLNCELVDFKYHFLSELVCQT